MSKPFPETSPGTSGLQLREPLLFEHHAEGRSGASLPSAGVPLVDPSCEMPPGMLRGEIAGLEADVKTCEARMATASGAARELYEKDRAELSDELVQKRRELTALG